MNIRKNIDYSGLYAGIDNALAANLPQMELYLELGRLVSGRPEKGAAVIAAEYIAAIYPNRTGFSPRNLRRMRDFYRMYEGHPEALAQAMKNSWTQNIVVLEADLDMDARCWYLRTAWQLGWSKAELIKQIDTGAHLEKSQDLCYTDRDDLAQGMSDDEEDTVCQQTGQLLEPDRRGSNGKTGKGYRNSGTVADQYGGCRRNVRGALGHIHPKAVGGRGHRVPLGNATVAPKPGLRPARSAYWDGPAGPARDVPYLRWGFLGQDVTAFGPCQPSGRYYGTTRAKEFATGFRGYPGRMPGAAGAVVKAVITNNEHLKNLL